MDVSYEKGWRLISKFHDGVLMPEHWERKIDGEWQFRDAHDGDGGRLRWDGEFMGKIPGW